jgi:diaminopropionate ammonia-lyase
MSGMDGSIKIVHNENVKKSYSSSQFGVKAAAKAAAFHAGFPEYAPTPLVRLKGLAAQLGVADIYVKDESKRFGLNAFKALGGSYAIGCLIAEKLGADISEFPYEKMTSAEVKQKIGAITFVTATDGNHGRGVAWTANRLGQKAVVYMPKGSAAERLANIKALGADASMTDMNYDDTVRFACKTAAEKGWVLVQDTSWQGYEKVPVLIMQGYTTMGHEIVSQLDGERPTHVFLQAGVGAMAGAVSGFLADFYGEEKPIITVVEPNAADCVFRTAEAGDGTLHKVTGSLNTIMAGLACGETCGVAWNVLRCCADNFVSMPDNIAAEGMRVLSSPTGGDARIISGESGAAAIGFAVEMLRRENMADIKELLKIDASSRILCISTEGDTDRENYCRIVWDGLYPGSEAL